jgi:septal ring factor EnvC (AmiA/AmiB activator)
MSFRNRVADPVRELLCRRLLTFGGVMSIGDLFSYAAPLFPAANSIVNEGKKWRKERTKRFNVLSMILTVLIAWAIIWANNRQHDAELGRMQNNAEAQSKLLSDLKAQNQTLLAQNGSLQKGMNDLQTQNSDLQTRNGDLQDDVNALRRRFKVKSNRSRSLNETLTTTDSIKVTVKRGSANP